MSSNRAGSLLADGRVRCVPGAVSRCVVDGWVRSVAASAIWFVLVLLPCPVDACRAHLDRWRGQRFEKQGDYEEAAYCHRVGMDFFACMLQLWRGAVYDERGDEVYQQDLRIFGRPSRVYCAESASEGRWDSIFSYWYLFMREGAARDVDLSRMSAAQRARMEDRLRIYNEDIMDPYSGLGCDLDFVQ